MKELEEILESARRKWPNKPERWDFLNLAFLLGLKAKTIVEFGLEEGFSTRTFLLTSKRKKKKIYSIDWLERYKERNLKTIKELKGHFRWKFIKADVTKIKWKFEKIDLLLADIGEENLEKGLENFYPFFSKEAVILVPALKHPAQLRKEKILKDFASKHPEWIYLEIETKYSIGILVKRE